jgi:PAS domain S-box-containing protein
LKHKTKEVDYKKLMKKYNNEDLEKNYEEFNKSVRSIKSLKQQNKELEKENKKLDKKLKRSKKKPVKKKKTGKKEKDVVIEMKNLYNKYSSFLFDILGVDEKRKEFDKIVFEFEERKKLLTDFEHELDAEKRKFNRSREAFIRWREKLETLEDEIEKRRTEVVDQESRFEKKLVESLKQNLRDKSINELESLISSKGVDQSDIHHEVLDKIPQSALIVQRGILKQINKPFSDMIGFDSDEIIDKSFFDFIAPEGLYGIEKYYINRLKGGESSSYDTIFLTNDNKMISAEVSIKPMLYNGEKADMVVVTGFDNTPSSDNDVQEFRSNSISKMEDASEEVSVPTETEQSIDETSLEESKPVTETEQTVVEPSPEEDLPLGGRKSQSEINEIINEMKPENEGDTNVSSEVKSSDEPPKEESKPEESSPAPGGKMNQDAIGAMFNKENTKKEKKDDDSE